MPISIYEAYPSRKTQMGERPTVDLVYHVEGTRDDLTVKAFVRAYAPATYDGLYQGTISIDETAPEHWECTVRYETTKPPERNDYEWSFDTTGGKTKITQSKATIASYAPAGEVAANHKGAIGVTDDGVEGCEIVTPEFKWSETWQFARADVDWTYAQTVMGLTGKTNDATFRGFAAGAVLFLGARGGTSKKDPSLVELTFQFSANQSADDQTIGDITGVDKGPWEYLWVRYKQDPDTTAKRLARKPEAAYAERVYDEGDFSDLGIGTGLI